LDQDDSSVKSKEKIQETSEVIDSCTEIVESEETILEEETYSNEEAYLEEETNLEEDINSEEETGSVKKDSQFSVRKSPSLFKILILAALVAGLFGSIVINITLLSQGDEIGSPTSSSTLQWVVIIAALFVSAISLGASFWLYYIRSLYLKDGPALVPEKWGVLINDLRYATNQSNMATLERLSVVIEASNHQSAKSEALLESFLTLQDTITSRDKEIARLKKGHDSKIFKRFITRFIQVSISLEEVREESKDSDQAKNYQYLCRKIQNALEECGVEQFSPPIGIDYRELGPEVDDDPKVLEIEDASKNFQIASVESPAYVIEGEGDREIILPSKVTIYKS
jgi:uncharacterized protein YaaR (DUF327 family)